MTLFPPISDAARYGGILVEKYQTFRGAKTEIDDQILVIENLLKRTETQSKFLRKVWDTLDPEYQDLQDRNFGVLLGKLQLAIAAIDKIEKRPSKSEKPDYPMGWSRRLRYAIYLKEPLERTICEVKEWQSFFEPSWYLMLRVSSPIIDEELSRNTRESPSLLRVHHLRNTLKGAPTQTCETFLPHQEIGPAEKCKIPYSTAFTASIVNESGFKEVLIVGDAASGDLGARASKEDIEHFVQRLKHAEPFVFHILNCAGALKLRRFPRTSSMDVEKPVLAFHIPGGMEHPRSLRGCLLSPCMYSISERVRISRQLAQSVSFVHMYGFLHKNIRPEEILVLQDGESDLGSLFLLGFKSFRHQSTPTPRAEDGLWGRNFYKHPARQGHPRKDYHMRHDVYSLGVCLLEIGLWESLVRYAGSRDSPLPSELLPVNVKMRFGVQPSQDHFMSLAAKRLPGKMGDLYTNVVLSCLDYSGCRSGEEGDVPLDQDGVVEGVRYIEDVS